LVDGGGYLVFDEEIKNEEFYWKDLYKYKDDSSEDSKIWKVHVQA